MSGEPLNELLLMSQKLWCMIFKWSGKDRSSDGWMYSNNKKHYDWPLKPSSGAQSFPTLSTQLHAHHHHHLIKSEAGREVYHNLVCGWLEGPLLFWSMRLFHSCSFTTEFTPTRPTGPRRINENVRSIINQFPLSNIFFTLDFLI